MNINISTNDEAIVCSVLKTESKQIVEYQLDFRSDEKLCYKKMKIEFSFPLNDVHAYWTPGQFGDRGIKLLWTDWGGFESKATTYAPVGTLLNLNNQNRLTVALSDALNAHQFVMGVSEEDKVVKGMIFLFTENTQARENYSVRLRFDTREIPFYRSLQDVSKWHENFYPPLESTDACFQPMYSTWYSFHQEFSSEEIEKQCERFVHFGLESVIVDDGWQTDDSNRGYAYCGDWKPSQKRFPNGLRAHVDRIHSMGMKYLLWYAVPFIGFKSEKWDQFKDRLIYQIEELEAGVLDIRFKEVRDYLISTYLDCIREFDVDGLKLDFVDSFTLNRAELSENSGYDIGSLQIAFDTLFKDLVTQVKELKEDAMIEFRQIYTGPAMRQYGNIFRAADCPGNVVQNRVRTTDLRLLSGSTAVHSDMIMWSGEDTVESAALQIINILFSVPQISVRIDEITEAQGKMLSHWIDFWKENRELFLSEDFRAFHPERNYSRLEGRQGRRGLIVTFANETLRLDTEIETIIINGGMLEEVVLFSDSIMQCDAFNVFGEAVPSDVVQHGLSEVRLPLSGYIKLSKRGT